jgi:hypothetical protein
MSQSWREARPDILRKRLLSLSAQKFVADLSRDAYHFAKLRVNGTTGGRGRPAAGVVRVKDFRIGST